MHAAFERIDTDGSGVLDEEEVKALTAMLGQPLSGKALKEAVQEMDTGGNGEIEFDEFNAW